MNVFISYKRETGITYARLIKMALEKFDVDVFMDIESLTSGKFPPKVFEYISNCDYFILICSQNALDECNDAKTWIRKEIDCAIKKKRNIIPIKIDGFKLPENAPAMVKEAFKYNGIAYSNIYFDAAIQKILTFMKSSMEVNPRERVHYFKSESEKKRLKSQQSLLSNFDRPIIDKILSTFDELTILDAGSGDGDMVMSRFGESAKVKKIIGLDSDKESVESANEQYMGGGVASFYNIDLESPDFPALIEEVMKKNSIKKFNVVIFSMIFLLLKKPSKVLLNIRKIMAEGGMVFVRDIDDGLNLAFDDHDENFSKAVRLCNDDEYSGYRQSGRQIYTNLIRNGFKDVKLEKVGLTTVGMSMEERENFFDMYFRFLPNDLEQMEKDKPKNMNIKKSHDWIVSKIDDLEDEFLNNEFFYLLGFMDFTAKK